MIWKFGSEVLYKAYLLENQMQKTMEHDMDTGFIKALIGSIYPGAPMQFLF